MVEFNKLLITMIIGGLTYSVMSFAYMHNTFSTSQDHLLTNSRMDRIDDRVQRRLEAIERKLDLLIKKK